MFRLLDRYLIREIAPYLLLGLFLLFSREHEQGFTVTELAFLRGDRRRGFSDAD